VWGLSGYTLQDNPYWKTEMSKVTPLAFNTAMKNLMVNQVYERDEAELVALALKGSTLNDVGLESASVLAALTREKAASPETDSLDLIGAGLYAAIGSAMFGDLDGARDAVSMVPLDALATAQTYGMVACLCSPALTTAMVAADPRIAEFGRCWTLSLSDAPLERREQALTAAVDLMIKAGLAGAMMECSLIMGAQTAAWQVYRLTHSQVPA
jgi:hypothetical protein